MKSEKTLKTGKKQSTFCNLTRGKNAQNDYFFTEHPEKVKKSLC